MSVTKPNGAIAIVGMAGRFPDARDLTQFWKNLRSGVESLTRFTDAELLASGVAPQQLSNPAYVRAGTVLERADEFDAAFFGVSPREASLMDPQQRVFLECAWEALEDAGYEAGALTVPVGVFAGASMNTYVFTNLLSNPEALAAAGWYQAMIGNDKDFLATRASYKLNLRGPSLTVQTACSTSLVAVHVACESLLTHQCDMALAGGVSLSFPQRAGYLYQEGMIFSPDGRVRPFDAGGRGIRAGAGVGLVVLKRLDDAIAAGDFIRAVILGTAVNNDGAQKVGYTAPSVDGQAQAIAAAQSLAGVAPESIGYIEAHGTATPLGDPIEIAALAKAFGSTARKQYCAIGSVKSNIGHLDAAAGVAGLIKTVLALQHRELPPSLNFNQPNPEIDFAASPFYVNAQLQPWDGASGPRRAGVSSFGIGGTNAHAVLEEAPVPAIEPLPPKPQLIVLSARSSAALEAASTRFAEFLESRPDLALADAAYTLQVGRKAFEHRRVLVTHDARGVREALVSRRALGSRRDSGHRNVAFMFSGQGSQHVGMGARLYATEPVFRDSLDECAERLRARIGVDLRTISDAAVINETAIAQPALFATEYSLARLWMHRGVMPQALLGHSIGEYVAACLAGVFSLDSALEIVAERGAVMQKQPPGAMLAVPAGELEIRAYLNDELAVAVLNAPGMCVVAGPIAAVDELERELEAAGLSGRRLRTSHAFHSAMMEPAVAPFVAAVSRHPRSAPRIPFVSNVSGTWITAAEAVDPAYWGRHLRSPVRFADGLRTLAADPTRLLIEVGPGSTLKTFARQTLSGIAEDSVVTSLPAIGERTAEEEFMLLALGRAWLAGAQVRWESLHEGRKPRRVSLPAYPFEGQRCWIEPAPRSKAEIAEHVPVEHVPRMADLRDWFWLPSWERSNEIAAGSPGALGRQRWLVFAAASSMCTALRTALAELGVETVMVRPGESFEAVSPEEYRITPDHPEDYARLLRTVRQVDAPTITCVVHLWSVGQSPSDHGRRLGFYSLLCLARELDEAGGTVALPVLIVTLDGERVLGNDVPDPSRALVVGSGLTMAQDVPFVRPRLIDLASADWTPDRARDLAAALRSEAGGELAPNRVAYRCGFRWVYGMSAPKLDEATAPFRYRGVYLITGGFGGLGAIIARHLARTVQARLVLLGRKAPQGADERAKLVLQLEALGAQVLVVAADVTDEAAMCSAVEQARTRFGKLNGVLHAAGFAGLGLLHEKTTAGVEDVLRPKVEGTLVIDRVLSGEELDFLVLFSSINSAFGFQGTGDYASANAFQDAFAQAGQALSTLRVVAINWGPWAEAGMAVHNVAANREFARAAIASDDGIEALSRVLASRHRQVFVSPKPMPGLLASVFAFTQGLQDAYLNNADAAKPATAVGDGSGAVASQHQRPDLRTQYVEPDTPQERALCAIWEELLGVRPVGVDDHFFDLGGHSLLATRVIARVQGAFRVRLTLRDAFDSPTVRSMAARIAAAAPPVQATVTTGAPQEREEIEF